MICGGGSKTNWAGGYTIAKVLALEELPGGVFKDITITLEETDQYPDDDGDGKVNHEDNCRWRANPDQVNTTADKNGDSCKAKCSEGGWPGVDAAPLQTNASGLRICKSELGYDFAFSFEDGSTIHSNMDVEVLGGKIILKPGQKSRLIHSWDPRVEKLPAPNISLPDLNSVKVKVHSAKSLDGTNGQTIFTHDGTSEYFNAGTDWQDFGIINNGEIENASDIEIEVGNENPLPVVESQPEPQPEQNPEPAIVEALQNVDAGSSEPDTAVETVSVAEPASPPVDSAVLAEQPAQIEPQL